MHVGDVRREARALRDFARSHGVGAHSAAVKGAEKRDEPFARGFRPARGFDRRFVRFSAARTQEHLLAGQTRYEFGELFGDVCLQRRIEIRAIDEQPAVGLIGDGGDDLGVAVAGGRDHAAREVEEDVAVDVFEHETAGLLDDDRGRFRAGGHGGRLARNDASTLRTR